MRGKITEIDEVNQRGYVQCIEEHIIMSALPFKPEDGLTLSPELIGEGVFFDKAQFWDEVRACNVRLARLEPTPAPELFV